MAVQGPADHFTRIQVDNDGQIQPAFQGPEIGDIAAPDPVRLFHRKLLVHPVGSYRQRMTTVGGFLESLGTLDLQARFLHQTPGPKAAHVVAGGFQRLGHPAGSIGLLGFFYGYGAPGTTIQNPYLSVSSGFFFKK